MDWVIFFQQLWYGVLNGITYAVFATGLTLIFGIMGIVNMAHGQLCMLGAMTAFSLMDFFHVNFLVAFATSILLVALFGFIFNRVVIRPLINISHLMVLLSTVAGSSILLQGSILFWGPNPHMFKTPFRRVLNIFDVRISEESIVVLVVGVIFIAATHWLIKKSRLGKLMRATGQDSLGAKIIGVNVERVYDYTVMISAGLAAASGMLLLPIECCHPGMGQSLLIIAFVVVIIGGMGNVKGCIVVGLLIGVIGAMFGQYVSSYFRMAFLYIVMIIVLLFKPEGLFARRK